METNLIASAYRELCTEWEERSAAERAQLLDRFKVAYSYNSGYLENPEITFHDTAEVFDKGGVSNFTGDIRTIYEMNNLKRSWEWLMEAVAAEQQIDLASLLRAHELLTAGTYDDDRWAKGERPGTFKRGDYRVANDVGFAPEEVEEAVISLLDQVQDAMSEASSKQNALTIAAFAHARLVGIHPFADGNGRTARLLMNRILLAFDAPPCTIDADDRLAYFGALDCFNADSDLEPFKLFLMAQTLKTWEYHAVVSGRIAEADAGSAHRSIPLDLGSYEPNEESLRSIAEADEIMAAGGTGVSFSSGRELLDAALKA